MTEQVLIRREVMTFSQEEKLHLRDTWALAKTTMSEYVMQVNAFDVDPLPPGAFQYKQVIIC